MSMRRVSFVAALAVCLTSSGAAQKPPPRDDVVVIDGTTNPEMIPQWAAWEFAFRVINGGSKLLPSNVHHAASKEERGLISAEAEANDRRDKACHARIENLRPLIGKEKDSVIGARQWEIQLDCRWQTLHARDRLLERLRPEVQTELIAFVEAMKVGTTVVVPKKELGQYRQPQ